MPHRLPLAPRCAARRATIDSRHLAMRARFSLAVLALALPLGACYRVTVNTGAPAASQTVEKPWSNSFVYGLVPPPVVNTASACPNGVAKVVTQHSFLNGLVSALTWSLYTPIDVRVTCAAGPVQR